MQSVFALVVLGSCLVASGLTTGQDTAGAPTSKVLTLLKDMVAQLQHEAEEDQETYDKMACWCETNDREKTKAINYGSQHINDLKAAIESLTAGSARLNTEIENLEKEIRANEAALDSATALRNKQYIEFMTEEKDMLSTIRSLKSAVDTLSKHHGASALVQQSKSAREEAVIQAAVLMKGQLRHHGDMLSLRERKVAAAFAESPDAYMGETALLQEGQPQSGEIFGVLTHMKENFETNLANAQREETENDKAYEDLKKAKNAEIAAGQSQSEIKTDELARSDEKNAQSKEDVEDTQQALAADTAFLSNLKEQCASMDSEFEERTKTRQMEIGAVSKALEYLSGDDTADLFSRTFNAAAFIQTDIESARRSHVFKILSAAAEKTGDPRLSTLAVATRIAAFGKVKAKIQNMIDKLIGQKEEDISRKDFCNEGLNKNERFTASKYRDQDDLEAKIDDLKMQIDEMSKMLDTLHKEVAEMQKQIKYAGDDRGHENHAFQLVVADQRAAQKLLTGAMNVMKQFYEKNALMQKTVKGGAKADQSPPAGFKKYEKNSSSGGAMGLISGCIQDAKKLEAEAIRGEENAQKAYEEFVMDTNDTLEAKNREITNKSKAKARAEVDKVNAQTESDATANEIKRLRQNNHDLHSSCDYLLKNFDMKQGALDDEIASLKEAIQIFSGASFGSLLQQVGYVR